MTTYFSCVTPRVRSHSITDEETQVMKDRLENKIKEAQRKME